MLGKFYWGEVWQCEGIEAGGSQMSLLRTFTLMSLHGRSFIYIYIYTYVYTHTHHTYIYTICARMSKIYSYPQTLNSRGEHAWISKLIRTYIYLLPYIANCVVLACDSFRDLYMCVIWSIAAKFKYKISLEEIWFF